MPKLLSIPEANRFFDEQIQAEKANQGREPLICLKVNPIEDFYGPINGNFWLALEFNAVANKTINTDDYRMIHQIWELQEEVLLRNNTAEQKRYIDTDRHIEPFYSFEFMGFIEYDTMNYNHEKLLIPIGAFHKLLNIYVNLSKKVRDNFDNIVGLENLKLIPLPDKTIGFSWSPPPDYFE